MKRYIWLLIIGLAIALCGSFIAVKPNQTELPRSISVEEANIISNLYLPPRKDFRAAIISDLNSQYGSTEYEPEVDMAISLIPQWQPDLVVCAGDAIAGQKTTLTKSEIEAMWAAFERHIAAPLKSYNVPFALTIGNHDGSGAIKNHSYIFKQERDLARAYWQQNRQQLKLDFIDRANFPFYYSFQINGIFFLVWDASTRDISLQQLDWVQQALNSSAARQATVKIVVGHLPLYPIAASKDKSGEYLADAEQLRSLLETNQVFMYISGHHHAYYPGKIGALQLLHAGALGQGARQLINSDLLPSQTLTILDLELEPARLSYTTYNAKTWKLLSQERLPRSISGDYGSIIRQDL